MTPTGPFTDETYEVLHQRRKLRVRVSLNRHDHWPQKALLMTQEIGKNQMYRYLPALSVAKAGFSIRTQIT